MATPPPPGESSSGAKIPAPFKSMSMAAVKMRQVTPLQGTLERIKKKYQRRIQRNAKKPGTDASKATFSAQAIADRDQEIERERVKFNMQPDGSFSPTSPFTGGAGYTIQDNILSVIPENELHMIPQNEQVLINQINLLLSQLRVVQAGNRSRFNAAGEPEQPNTAADQLIGAKRVEVLTTQNTVQSMATTVPIPVPMPTPLRLPTFIHMPALPIDCPIYGPQSPIPPPPPPLPPTPPAQSPPNQLEPAQGLDKGKRKTDTALAPPLAQRYPKRIKPTLVADSKGKGKALVEKMEGETTEAPILPFILLSQKQYVNLKKLVGQSIELKEIPHWTNKLRNGSVWDRRGFRCLRRNAFRHNKRMWAGWKRDHMALLALGTKAAHRRGREMELDAFMIENQPRIKRCIIGLYSGYMSRLNGMSRLKPGESPDRLWYFSPDKKEKAIQQREFSAYQATFIRYAASALGICGFADIGQDDASGDRYVPEGNFWIGENSIWLGDTEVEEDVILDLSDSDSSEEEEGDSEPGEPPSSDESEEEYDSESGDIGGSGEMLPESSDDVDSDASYTSGFLSDIESDGDDDNANREEIDGDNDNSGGGNVDAGGDDWDKDIWNEDIWNDGDDEAE